MLLPALLVALPAALAALPADPLDALTVAAEEPAWADPGPCEPTSVPGLGRTCRTTQGLYEIRLPDGRLQGYTHGPDHAHEGYEAQMSGRTPPSFWAPRMPYCVDGLMGESYAKVLYVRTFDDGPTWARNDDFVRSLVMQGNGLVDMAADASSAETYPAEQGGNHADLVVQCAQGEVKVERVVIWAPLALVDMSVIVGELQGLGYDQAPVHYWIYFDDVQGCTGCLGMANYFFDPTPGPGNLNNGMLGPRYAVTFEVDEPRTMLHELTHTMGGGLMNSTNAAGSHVTDGNDIMSVGSSTEKCTVMEYDCGRDDYFHIAPAPGSFLTENWNLASAGNDYIQTNGSVVDLLQCTEDGFVGVPLACTMAGGNLEAIGVRFTVEWGDGSTSTVDSEVKAPAVATHAYAAPGTYRIHVSATDVGGAPQPSGRVPYDVLIKETPDVPLVDCVNNLAAGSFADCPVRP